MSENKAHHTHTHQIKCFWALEKKGIEDVVVNIHFCEVGAYESNAHLCIPMEQNN